VLRVSFWFGFLGGLLLLACNVFAVAQRPADDVLKILPKEVESFRQVGSIRQNIPFEKENSEGAGSKQDSSGCVGAEADYVSTEGGQLLVELVRCARYSAAYSLLTVSARRLRNDGQSESIKIKRDIGTAGLVAHGRVVFFKGPTFVSVSELKNSGREAHVVLARLIADRLEPGEADIPVLVKHLPRWEEAQERVVYFSGFNSLKDMLPDQPILEAVSSEGDADAVTAPYGNSQIVVVEFNTPQLAADNDRRIIETIQELRSQGQPVPSAYRRVGNYSVFVFNAENEQTANALIDQVKYEQVVQWLGDNPNLLAQAQRDYYQTTAGVLVAVVKASGLSLLVCLAIGGLFGAILFKRRRAQQQTAETFSDAGGMLRLNIDEMTTKTDSVKLLGPGH